ncbi:competence/damage-inducible protein A [Dehalococcoidia bacterium]|nr:competence/damage-inducible protein A [Dehalococcoidia bacterium]
MKAEIMSIGTELLLGEIVDTNAPYLASQLPALGIDVYYLHQVGDNKERLVEVMERAWGRSDLVLCTGGLGPTEDDRTRAVIAEMLGEAMVLDSGLEADLRSFFGKRSMEMPENNLKQAMLIPSSMAIPNPRGTAPGWWVEKDDKMLAAMPGPPRELRYMWENEVRPRLRARVTGGVLVSRTLKVTGISEGAVDEMAGNFLASGNPTIGVYAKPDGIHVRIAAKATDEATALALVHPVEDELRKRFGDNLWGTDEESMQEHIGQLLVNMGMTVATMESCTGGLFSSTITDVPGSSGYFKGGFVTYTNEAKIAYGVDSELIGKYGAISPQTAEAMARAARTQLGADVGVGITGVAGPSEQEGKPVGTVFIGVDHQFGGRGHATRYQMARQDVKVRAVTSALFQLRQFLLQLH